MANAISVTISATDRATEVINRVNRGFEDFNRRVAKISDAGERFGKSVSKLGDVSGVNRIATGIGDIGRRVVGATESLGRFAPALGGITGAASIAGLAKLAETWSGFSARLGLDAARINTSASTLHGLQGAARLAGSSAEALTDGMRTLGDNLVNAVAGRSPETVVMLRTLGIGFRDASTGGARLAEDVLPEVADKIKNLRTPALQAMVATRLFGGAGEALLPFLRRGAAGIAEYNEQAKRYGVQNQAGVQAAMDFREAQTRVSLAVEGLAYSVSERLAPVLVPMLTRFADWIASHRADVASFFEGVARRLDAWATGGGPMRLVEGLQEVGVKIGKVVELLGGWENAAILVAGVMASQVLVNVLSVLGAVTKLTFAIGTQLVAAIGLAETAMRGFNTRTLANPLLRAASLGIWLFDRVGQGISPEQLTPEQRERLGIAPNTVPGAVGDDGAPSWWQRNMPTWLGGRGPARDTGLGPAGATPGENRGAGLPPGGSRATTTTFDTTLTPEARGLLDTIAGTESPGYNVMYGGRRFRDMSHHPGVETPITSGPNAGQSSTAAGRYQFLRRTWDEVAGATGATDFGPASQDRGAWWLAQRDYNTRTGRDLATDLRSTDPQVRRGIGQALHGTWTSLPGGIEAGTNDDRFTRQLNTAIQRNRAVAERTASAAPPPQAAPAPVAPPPPPLAAPVPLPPAPPAGQPGPNGRVAVSIDFQNQPPGLRMTTSTEGGVTVRAPRIETAMPGWTAP